MPANNDINNWRPSPDQQAQIQNDARLQRLTKQELYSFFNRPNRPTQGTQNNQPQRRQESQPQRKTEPVGFIDMILNALRGN